MSRKETRNENEMNVCVSVYLKNDDDDDGDDGYTAHTRTHRNEMRNTRITKRTGANEGRRETEL